MAKKKKISRFDANQLILEKLTKLSRLWPDQRFGQLLINMGIIEDSNMFFTESSNTLEILNSALKYYKVKL